MNKKLLGMLLLLVMLISTLGNALTVSAEAMEPPEDIGSIALDELNREEVLEDLADLGFKDGIMWMTSVFDGREGVDGIETIADMDKIHFLSTELEPDHYYLVTLVFVAEIDSAVPEKYKDVYLQVRFPTVLFKDSVNAIGSAIHGEKISTKGDSFGITASTDLSLYYIEDSAVIDCFKKQTYLIPDGAKVLFASKQGIPLHEALAVTYDLDGQQCAMFEVSFLLYAAELDADAYVYRGDSELTYWAGRKLMHDMEDSVAPTGNLPTVAIMDEDGTVHLPEIPSTTDTDDAKATEVTEKVDYVLTIVLGIVVLALCGFFVYVVIRIRKTAHEQGITGFKNIFMAFMDDNLFALDDNEDDYYEDEACLEENDQPETPGEETE